MDWGPLFWLLWPVSGCFAMVILVRYDDEADVYPHHFLVGILAGYILFAAMILWMAGNRVIRLKFWTKPLIRK